MRESLVAIIGSVALMCACERAPGDAMPLPQLDGLGLTRIGEPDDGDPNKEQWCTVVDVDITARGRKRVADVHRAARWRGFAFGTGKRTDGRVVPFDPRRFLNIKIGAKGEISVEGEPCGGLADMDRLVAERLAALDGVRVLLSVHIQAAYGSVLPVLAVLAERVDRLSVMAFEKETTMWTAVHGLPLDLARVAPGQHRCLRIRAAETVPFEALHWILWNREEVQRLSFVGLVGGKEVEIGAAWDSPDLPEPLPRFARPGEAVPRKAGERPMAADRGPGPFGFRSGDGRRRTALTRGGSGESERAVDAALGWLVRHQEPDGRWEAAEFGGKKGNDPGVTGLAVLALLGAGHTEKAGEHKEAVTKAVDWIISRQDESGCIGAGSPKLGYHHAICGLALAEAYGMAELERTRIAAQKAVDYSVNVHQQKHGGWRYEPGQGSDTSVTGWFMMQLKSAVVAGLRMDARGFQGAIGYLGSVTELPAPGVQFPGRAKYMVGPGEEYTQPMTAIVMLCRQWMGWRRHDPLLVGGANYLYQSLPVWEEADPGMKSTKLDFYYWHFGSLAMFQMGGDWWEDWNACVRDMLVEKQHNRPDHPALDGSWDPVGYSGAEGGRVFSTAMGAMCLETYYRYMSLYK